MRPTGIAVATVLIVAVLSGSGLAGARSSSALTIKIPLPPPNSAKASKFTITSAGPLTVSALDQAQLGSKLNTQAIAVIGPKTGGTYTVLVFIHRFTPLQGFRATAAARGEEDATVAINSPQGFPHLVQAVLNWGKDCAGLRKSGYFGDAIWGKQLMANLVKAMNSPPEEQLDNTINNLCAGAEADDPGSS